MHTLKNTRDWVQALLLCSLLGFANMALAAGFEAEASDMVKTFRTGVYAVVGVVAGLALLWNFVQGWGGR